MYPNKITDDTQLKAYYDSFIAYPNKTQIGLLYCAGASQSFQLNIFCDGTKDYAYYLVLNKTDSLSVIFHDLLEPMPVDEVAVSLKVLFSLFSYLLTTLSTILLKVNLMLMR